MIKKYLLIYLLISLLGLLGGCNAKVEKLTSIDDYDKYLQLVKKSDTFMPNLELIGIHEKVNVYYYERQGPTLYSKSINLIITYSDTQYELYKWDSMDKNEFLEEPFIQHGHVVIPEVKFDYKEFEINVVKNDSFWYPSQFGMIGYSDINKQICYIFYYDIELDMIADMVKFLDSAFAFE